MASNRFSNPIKRKTSNRHTNRIEIFVAKQNKLLSAKSLESFLKYNDKVIVHSISDNTGYRNLNHFVLLAKTLQKDWVGVM